MGGMVGGTAGGIVAPGGKGNGAGGTDAEKGAGAGVGGIVAGGGVGVGGTVVDGGGKGKGSGPPLGGGADGRFRRRGETSLEGSSLIRMKIFRTLSARAARLKNKKTTHRSGASFA